MPTTKGHRDFVCNLELGKRIDTPLGTGWVCQLAVMPFADYDPNQLGDPDQAAVKVAFVDKTGQTSLVMWLTQHFMDDPHVTKERIFAGAEGEFRPLTELIDYRE